LVTLMHPAKLDHVGIDRQVWLSLTRQRCFALLNVAAFLFSLASLFILRKTDQFLKNWIKVQWPPRLQGKDQDLVL
jgi:hypothetical protein